MIPPSRQYLPHFLVAFALSGLAGRAARVEAPAGPNPDEVRKVKAYIHATWPATFRTTNSKENPVEMELPTRFTVPTPGAGFRMFFYWDTYFTSLGLVRDGYSDLACDNADTMLYLIETLGFVPNFTFVGSDYRSQPPVAALQVELCLRARLHLGRGTLRLRLPLECERHAGNAGVAGRRGDRPALPDPTPFRRERSA